MGTNSAPLVADLFLFCYERDFMMSLSDDKQADIIDAFNTTSRYLDDNLNINNIYFDNMVGQIYPSELQLCKANTSDTKARVLYLHLSISYNIVSTKIYDKCDDCYFETVNSQHLDGDVPHTTSYGVFAFVFNCTLMGWISDSMTVLTLRLINRWDGWGLMLRGLTVGFSFSPVFSCVQCWVLIFV